MHPANDVATIRKIALCVGIPALVVAVAMTFQFGRSMSFLHAVCLGLLTVAGSIIFPYAKHMKSESAKGALMFMVIGAVFLSVEFFSHLGYTVGTRVIEAESTDVVNAVYDNNQASAKDDTANLKIWRDQLTELQAKQPWVASVKADALRSQMETADKAITNETARGGCKSKCEAKMRERDAISERIGQVEQSEDLIKRIEATQRILDGKRVTANKTEFKTSAVVAQTGFVAQLVTQNLDPDKASRTWVTIAIGALVSLVSTFLAPVMLTIAFGPLKASEIISASLDKLGKVAKPATDAKGNMVFNVAGDDGWGRKIVENLMAEHKTLGLI
jgi:hypothetical protein